MSTYQGVTRSTQYLYSSKPMSMYISVYDTTRDWTT